MYIESQASLVPYGGFTAWRFQSIGEDWIVGPDRKYMIAFPTVSHDPVILLRIH
jgi:hypothetical protein